MTNEEAISELKGFRMFVEGTRLSGELRIEAIDMAIDALHENESLARSVNEASELLRKRIRRWIPCSDRLPEEQVNVLFCDVDEDIYVGIRYRGRWWAGEDDPIKNVVAWMPLPDPYKKGGDPE